MVGVMLLLGFASPARGLPPPSDVPEEILRTEIITQARSPIDGEAIAPAEYAALIENLEPVGVNLLPPQAATTASIGVSGEENITNILPIRDLLRAIFPF
jgi:hypothetical protein